jgi:aminoglycoside phosphotransferase
MNAVLPSTTSIDDKVIDNFLQEFLFLIMLGHVRDSVQQIDSNTWLIDQLLVLHRHRSLDSSDHLWQDRDGWRYTITDTSIPPPTAVPIPTDKFPKLVYDVGDASVVFDLGDALLKVKDRHPFQGVTPEPATLQWLAERTPSFPVPRTLHYTETANRIYFVVSRVPGRSIDEAWRELNTEQKQHCVQRVAQICLELSAWTSDSITGVDGNRLFDPWLDMGAKDFNLSADNLLHNCEQLNSDTSKLVLSHNDLGPTNVMVDVENDCKIGIVDWEMAGFVPMAWIRTKLAACFAMDFCWRDTDVDDPSRKEWRVRLAQELGKHGVSEEAEKYTQWRNNRSSN